MLTDQEQQQARDAAAKALDYDPFYKEKERLDLARRRGQKHSKGLELAEDRDHHGAAIHAAAVADRFRSRWYAIRSDGTVDCVTDQAQLERVVREITTAKQPGWMSIYDANVARQFGRQL